MYRRGASDDDRDGAPHAKHDIVSRRTPGCTETGSECRHRHPADARGLPRPAVHGMARRQRPEHLLQPVRRLQLASAEHGSGVGTSASPELAVLNDRLVMVWKGIDNNQDVWFTTYDGSSWAPQSPVPGIGTNSGVSLSAGPPGSVSSARKVSGRMRQRPAYGQTGRQRKYCSTACKQKAYRLRAKQARPTVSAPESSRRSS
jgi:hypothetical protein